MHVILVAPHFPSNQRRFVRGLKNVGARVTGIGDAPASVLDAETRSMLDGYEQVPNVCDVAAMTEAVQRIQRRGPWVHHLEATVEAHMYCAAEVRERTGIPGLSYRTVDLCRDKFIMKQELRRQGVPCARNAAVSSAPEARAFVAEVGFPVILKPRDGAGASATYRIDDEAQLQAALRETGLDQHKRHFTMEEFISGHEGFYDTITCNGEVVFEAVSHYYPNVLEAMRTRWINPQILVTNRIDASGYNELRHFGREVVRKLEIGTSATHMEWFYGAKGLAFSEIGARPPGCRLWDMYNQCNDIDLYTEWARALCWGSVEAKPSRRFSGGIISIRPSDDGVIKGYSGVNEVMARYGQWIHELHLPAVGSRTNAVGAGYLAHAYVCAHHPDYDVCRSMMDDIGQTLKMWAG